MTAIPDITARARTVFRLVNGSPTAFEADGKTVRFGKDGMTPMTLEEWVDTEGSTAKYTVYRVDGGLHSCFGNRTCIVHITGKLLEERSVLCARKPV